MSRVTQPPMTFEEYLDYDNGTEARYEWVDGVLVEVPTESEWNAWLSLALQLYLINAGLVKPRLTHRYSCEIEVPVLQPRQPRNRFPDLVILRPEHIALTQKRLTIRADMPPPVLVVEVVSPGQTNRQRDYKAKRLQYQARGIAEYWLLDPEDQCVVVFSLGEDGYEESVFRGGEQVRSPLFPGFALTAEQLLHPEE